MSGPKYSLAVNPIPVGDLSAPDYIESFHAHALVVSEGHCPRGGRRDSSGAFYVWKRDVTHSGGGVFTWSSRFAHPKPSAHAIMASAGGTLRAPKEPFGGVPSYQSVTDGLSGQYAEGYAKARPGNPVAGLAQFTAELRDLPKAPFQSFFGKRKRNRRWSPLNGHSLTSLARGLRQRSEFFKNLGSEYLNYVFGWRPFVSDLRKTYHLTKEIDRRMAQLIRENGKRINRKATVSRKRTFTAGADSTSQNDVSQDDNMLMGNDKYSRTYNRPFWGCVGAPGYLNFEGRSVVMSTHAFSEVDQFFGQFQYNIDNPGSLQWQQSARLMLFGAIPTPEVVWALTPWSWLVDWCANVDSIMSNASINAVGSTPIVWSSGMTRVRIEESTSNVSSFISEPWSANDKWKAMTLSLKSSDRTYIKARVSGGNPFGLNVKLPDLSPGQLAILAALGISRGKVK